MEGHDSTGEPKADHLGQLSSFIRHERGPWLGKGKSRGLKLSGQCSFPGGDGTGNGRGEGGSGGREQRQTSVHGLKRFLP